MKQDILSLVIFVMTDSVLSFLLTGFNIQPINYNILDFVRVCSVFSCNRLFATPWTVAHQDPLTMGFPRQEYQSGLPFPPPGDFPDSGIEPAYAESPALAGRFFTMHHLGIPKTYQLSIVIIKEGDLYGGQEAAVRNRHGKWTGSKLGNECVKAVLSLCLFNLHAQYIMQNAGLDESLPGIKISRKNINNLRYADDNTFMAENKEELKSLLMKMKKLA